MRKGRTRLPTIEEISDRCTLCGELIHPSQVMRLGNDTAHCPHCGKDYTYASKVGIATAPPIEKV